MAKTILVGANHAGTACANTILSYPNQELTIYDQNSNISFLGCGMALWIGEQIHSGDGLFYAKPENFLEKGAKVNMESRVLSVDYDKKTVKVELKDGKVIEDHYDNLVFATGSIPNRILVKGFDLENVQMVKLYQNAAEVIEKLKRKGEFKKVCVLGGGYIGVELAEAFQRLGLEVTLIDMVDRILAGYFDAPFSDELKNRMEEHGIKLALGEKVEEFLGEGKVSGVKTDKGVYDADMVICPSVYAIGDCASLYDNARGRENYIALATNAVRSGVVAGHNICGTPVESLGVQGSSALGIYGYKLACTGLSLAAAEREGMDVSYEDYEDTQFPAFMEVENPKVKIRIVYKKEDKKIVGCQLGSSYDATAIIHFFSLAIQKGLTMAELPLVDLFFMPHFNQPYNYVTRAGLNWLNKELGLKD